MRVIEPRDRARLLAELADRARAAGPLADQDLHGDGDVVVQWTARQTSAIPPADAPSEHERAERHPLHPAPYPGFG